MSETGRVVLVGAGPGDPDLITVRGTRALARADVVLYDELATGDLLDLAPARALRINVGKRGHEEPTRSQADINALLVEHARAGRTVVRLKGGDPLVFGRGGEEMTACVEAGIPFEVVPGVTSAIAALTYAGIPITDRRHSASFAVVTGHKDPSRAAEGTRWRELGRAVDTLVILMGMRNLEALVAELIAGGKAPSTPAAAIMHGTLPQQRTCVATLADLPRVVREQGFGAPSAIVIGEVVRLREGLSWWERRPLFGRKVLVTRARDQVAELAAVLRSAGAEPVIEPMIELVAVDDAGTRREIAAALERLDDYGILVFTSSNAVRFFAGELESLGERAARLATDARTFCVGERTAEVALEVGLPVHVVASGRSDAEALLGQLLESLPTTGQRVLIPRSRIGRSVIADGLRRAGHEVDSIAFYENRRPAIDCAGLRDRLVRGELYALTFTSPSTVDHFLECLDEAARAAAARCMIAAIGRTTARRLEACGLPATVVPDRPDMVDLVEALAAAAAAEDGGAPGDPRRTTPRSGSAARSDDEGDDEHHDGGGRE
ncbi:MAG: uroporphyrinogen-III C-methyltransferase [Spirochaetaceae bacterium]|nr:uroporphyrinogen-III C-methyltransferase [Myxococcales bacterium]MCB9726768.1 uroporphyrinogen-III C-methyltransferase [Spirochaetaceae bacterium]